MSRDRSTPAPDFLAGGGELGALLRERDWAATSLGPAEAWPQSLKTAVRIVLTSRQPMFVWWGDELINLYNDAYRAIVGGKHPEALGQPASVVWREIWDDVHPRAESVLRDNVGTYDESLLLIMERYGYPEETYYTFSYSPIPGDDGGTAGIICANTDDTQRIVGERQLLLLREVAARTSEARTVADACESGALGLASNPYDLPFAMIYLVDAERNRAVLAGTSGIEPGHPAAPESVSLDDATSWPFAEALASHGMRLVSELGPELGELPTGAWQRPPSQAVLAPIAAGGQSGRGGILVAGLNPFRIFDDGYRGFVGLAAAQLAAALGNANAYEEERSRAESLAELDRVKTAFFSNVSHEFRTPLTLMLGPLEELVSAPAERVPDATREQLSVVYRNGQRLLRLVNTLLDFSRIEAGRVEAVYVRTDLAEFTSDLASMFRSAMERAGLRYTVACAPLGDDVYVDRDMWEKIVFNLVSNAFKFTLDGTVDVSLGRSGDRIELEVRDTGVGVPAAELPRLFERFHRVEGVAGRTHEGSGIGLALVQELVRLHGGEVRVESEHGVGTSFVVAISAGTAHLPLDRVEASTTLAPTRLPSSAFVEEALRWLPESDASATALREAAVAPSRSPRAPGAARARVLVADDNADMRDYVRRLLAEDYDVEAVADGEAAFVAAGERPPDIVLSDVMMPRLDGFGLIERLRADERLRTIPVILLSARAGEESRVEGLEAGADDYLVKPFGARELLARVATHLEMARVREASARVERALREEADVARRAAEAASRAKDEFLATISHELRTPLNSMLGWARMLRTGRLDAETRERAIETIERNTISQAQLIEDLLDISRIITGKLRLNVQPVDLTTVVRAAVDSNRPAADARAIRLQMVLDTFTGTLLGDPERLQQVVWNLVSNAVKFTPKGGRVQIHVERINSHVEITVADTGRGIEPDFLPFVFDRFRQADSSIVREVGGLGLGLAIVRHIAELHGGTVFASSEGTGKGSVFTVHLPLSISRRPSTESESVHATAGGVVSFGDAPSLAGLHLLVVDDEADTRDLVAFVLGECGAEVRLASSAREALDLLGEWVPDLLISDIGMPGADGYALVAALRAHESERVRRLPVVALTAYARAEDRVRLFSSGFEAHLPKPVEPVELVAVVAGLTRRRV